MSKISHTAEAIELERARELEAHARWLAGLVTNPREQEMWLAIADEWRSWLGIPTAEQSPATER